MPTPTHRGTFVTADMAQPALDAVEQLRAAALTIKKFDSVTGASPSLEEIHLPGGFVIGLIQPGEPR